jgi:hypothetical protein
VVVAGASGDGCATVVVVVVVGGASLSTLMQPVKPITATKVMADAQRNPERYLISLIFLMGFGFEDEVGCPRLRNQALDRFSGSSRPEAIGDILTRAFISTKLRGSPE